MFSNLKMIDLQHILRKCLEQREREQQQIELKLMASSFKTDILYEF